MYGDAEWIPGERFEAVCGERIEWYDDCAIGIHPADEPVPVPACRCGIYAVADTRALPPPVARWRRDWRRDIVVPGRVRLGGRVIRGNRGARAQYGYPSLLYVPESLLEDDHLLEYGVPLAQITPELEARAHTRTSHVSGDLRSSPTFDCWHRPPFSDTSAELSRALEDLDELVQQEIARIRGDDEPPAAMAVARD